MNKKEWHELAKTDGLEKFADSQHSHFDFPTKTTNFNLGVHHITELDAIAKTKKITRSKLMRQILDDHLGIENNE